MLRLIEIYQRWISPFLPPHCRFIPTCSSYASDAISQYGVARGSVLAVKRVCKCHPFHPGGYDPVPSDKPTKHPTEYKPKSLEQTSAAKADSNQPPTHRQNTVNQ